MALTATAGSDTKRSIIIVIVALLHVGAYYVIESGLSHQIISMLAPPVKTKIIEEQIQPEDLPPPPPPPDIVEPPPFIPPPEVAVQIQTQTTAIQAVTNERPPAVIPPVVAPPPPKASVTVQPKQDPKRRLGSVDEYYPSGAKRRGEEGSAIVQIYVGADGRVSEAKLDSSTGYPELDEAAIKYAKTWRVLPGTVDGVPQPMWWKVRVTFKLPK